MTTIRQHDYLVATAEDALVLAKAQLRMATKYYSGDKEKIAGAKKEVAHWQKTLKEVKANREEHIKKAAKRKK